MPKRMSGRLSGRLIGCIYSTKSIFNLDLLPPPNAETKEYIQDLTSTQLKSLMVFIKGTVTV